MRRIYIILALCMLAGSGWAQQKGVQSESLRAAWAPVKVDHYLGVRGGYAMAKGTFEPSRQSEFLNNLYFGGITYKFDVPKQKYVGMIEVDITWTQKGYSRHYYFDSPDVEQRKYNEIEIPILWQPYLPLGRGGSRFYISAGPFVSYAFKSTIRKNYDKAVDPDQGWEKYEYDPLQDNRWGYGITAGAGFLIAVNRWSISVDARYNIGMSDILKGVEKVPENIFFRSRMDQVAISIGVNYKISQAGTKALELEPKKAKTKRAK